MNEDEKWLQIDAAITALKESNDKLRRVEKYVMIAPESPLMKPYFEVEEMLVKFLSIFSGDEFETFDWFVLENDYGRKKMEAGCDCNRKKIETVADLRWLIELQRDRAAGKSNSK